MREHPDDMIDALRYATEYFELLECFARYDGSYPEYMEERLQTISIGITYNPLGEQLWDTLYALETRNSENS
jgi:hypothetical protein